MKIPKKVKVGGTTYTVTFKKILDNGSEYLGYCDYEDLTIALKKGKSRESVEVTFLHELIHALFCHCDLQQDEHLVEQLTQALYMLIKDNPGIFSDKKK